MERKVDRACKSLEFGDAMMGDGAQHAFYAYVKGGLGRGSKISTPYPRRKKDSVCSVCGKFFRGMKGLAIHMQAKHQCRRNCKHTT